MKKITKALILKLTKTKKSLLEITENDLPTKLSSRKIKQYQVEYEKNPNIIKGAILEGTGVRRIMQISRAFLKEDRLCGQELSLLN